MTKERHIPLMWMRQCTLERSTSNGFIRYVAWVPEKFASLGKALKLKFDGVWVDGYRVQHVGARQTVEESNKASQSHKKHRKHSDRMRSTKNSPAGAGTDQPD